VRPGGFCPSEIGTETKEYAFFLIAFPNLT